MSLFHRLARALLLAGLVCAAGCDAAYAQAAQVVNACGDLDQPLASAGRFTVTRDGRLCTTGTATGGSSGAATVTGSQEQDVRASQSLNVATAGATIVYTINGQSTLGFTFTGLAASGATLSYEQSNDGGTTWTTKFATNVATGRPEPTRSTDGQIRMGVAGHTNVRLRVSTAGTGSITVASNISVRPEVIVLAGPIPPGENPIGSIFADLRVGGSAVTANNPVPMAGNVAAGAADSGNPVKIGGVFNTTSPTLTSGQRGDVQLGPFGQVMTTLQDSVSQQPARVVVANNDATSPNTVGLVVNSRPLLWNGNVWPRAATAPAASGTDGIGIAASNPVPTTANVGIVQAVANGANSLAVKNAAGNLYGYGGTMGTTAGFIALLDLAAVPGAGVAISPRECITMAAGASFRSPPQVIPYRYLNGVQVVATTSCAAFNAPANAAVNLNAAVQ